MSAPLTHSPKEADQECLADLDHDLRRRNPGDDDEGIANRLAPFQAALLACANNSERKALRRSLRRAMRKGRPLIVGKKPKRLALAKQDPKLSRMGESLREAKVRWTALA